MQPLEFIANYYGEKKGFYFSWLVNYTAQLILPSFVGSVILCYQIYAAYRDKTPPLESFNTLANIWYAVFLMIWTTWFVESWKRKQNIIGHKWLMREFHDSTTDRSDFKADLDVDVETKKKWMVSVTNTYLRTVFVGIPTTAFFVAGVIGAQMLQWAWKERNARVYDVANGGKVPLYIGVLPSIVNTVLIQLFAQTYKRVALMLVNNENHRQTFDYENSLILKTYMFTFVNAYISNYIYAFYVKDFYAVALNLVVIIVLTNIGLNVVEYCIGRFWINRKIQKVAAKYEDEITKAEDAC